MVVVAPEASPPVLASLDPPLELPELPPDELPELLPESLEPPELPEDVPESGWDDDELLLLQANIGQEAIEAIAREVKAME